MVSSYEAWVISAAEDVEKDCEAIKKRKKKIKRGEKVDILDIFKIRIVLKIYF